MNTPLKSRITAILGSATIPGLPEEVFGARAFVARTLSAADKTPALDSDAATLLTSELVTNAIQHTASGAPGRYGHDRRGQCAGRGACRGDRRRLGRHPSRQTRPADPQRPRAAAGAATRRAVGLPAGSGRNNGLVPTRRRSGRPTAARSRSARWVGRRCGSGRRRGLGRFRGFGRRRYRGEHARADRGQVIVAGHVRRHRVDQVAERAKPHPSLDRGPVAPGTSTSSSAARRRSRRAPGRRRLRAGRAAGASPVASPASIRRPRCQLPGRPVQQHLEPGARDRAGERVAHERRPVGEQRQSPDEIPAATSAVHTAAASDRYPRSAPSRRTSHPA